MVSRAGWSALAFLLAGVAFLLFAQPAHAEGDEPVVEAPAASATPVADEVAPADGTAPVVSDAAPTATPPAASDPQQGSTVVIDNRTSGTDAGAAPVDDAGGSLGGTRVSEHESNSNSSSNNSPPSPATAAGAAAADAPLAAPDSGSGTIAATSSDRGPTPPGSAHNPIPRVASSVARTVSGVAATPASPAVVASACLPADGCGAGTPPQPLPIGRGTDQAVSVGASPTSSASDSFGRDLLPNVSNIAALFHGDAALFGLVAVLMCCIALGKGRLANGIGIRGDTQAGTVGSANSSNSSKLFRSVVVFLGAALSNAGTAIGEVLSAGGRHGLPIRVPTAFGQ